MGVGVGGKLREEDKGKEGEKEGKEDRERKKKIKVFSQSHYVYGSKLPCTCMSCSLLSSSSCDLIF